MSVSKHSCTSHNCSHTSHNDSSPRKIQISKEAHLSFITHQKEIKAEERRSAEKAYKIKLKNKRNKRSGIDVVDTSGNELQSKTAKRLFIMEHLAKMRFMESLGLGHTVPSLAEILKKYRAE